MMSMLVAKIIGPAGKNHWSQVHTFKPGKEKLSQLGNLLLVISIDSSKVEEKEELELTSVGKEFIQRFHEQYYGIKRISGPVLNHLSETVKDVVREFSELDIEVIAGVVLPEKAQEKKGVLYIAANSTACFSLLMRDEKLYKLYGKGDDVKLSSPLSVATSGFVKAGDTFILGAGNLEKFISIDILRQALLTKDASEIGSVLAPLLHEDKRSIGTAAVVGRIEREESERKSVEVTKDKVRREAGLIQRIKLNLEGRINKIKSSKNWLGKIVRLLPLRFVSSQPRVVVKGEGEKQRRLMFSVAFVILILLAVSIILGWRRRVVKEQEERFNAIWEVTEHQYMEAISLIEINPLRSRSLLVEAKDSIEQFLVEDKARLAEKQIEKLSERLVDVQETLEQVSGEHKIGEASIFLDLNLVRPDTYGEVMVLHENTLVVLDRTSEVLLRIEVDKKSAEAVGGGQFLTDASLAAVYSGRGFVVSNYGVVEVLLENKTSAVVIERDPEWGEIIDIQTFAGNLYLLDRVQSEIFRYQGAEGGFGNRRRWLGEGVFPDLNRAISMAIDGDIWVLDDKDIMRFRRGVRDTFTIAGLDKQFKDPTNIYTDAESENLYILDKGNQRIVVINKNGEYEEQYIWEGLESVLGMVVNEDEGKILLLSGSVIYEIELEE